MNGIAAVRRLIVIAFLSAALGVAAATGATGKPIPWQNTPLPLWRLPQPTPIPYSAGAPLCTARALRVHLGRHGAATGHLLEEFVFTNIGHATCLLRGYPVVRGRRIDGKLVVLRPRHGTFFGQLVAADLKSGGHVFLDFETDDVCGNATLKAVVYHDLRFTLPRGGEASGGTSTLSLVCGLAMSQFGLPARYTGSATPAPGSVGSLQADIKLPATVRRGAILNYVVTLANHLRRAVRFKATSCPGYTQGLYTNSVQVRGSYRLNCGSVQLIPTGEARGFAMKLRVPRNATLGLAKLGWNLDTETGAFAGATIEVTR
jgi:hypothetical protein